MARSHRNKSSILDELFALLSVAPTWMGPLLAIVVFATARWGIPLVLTETVPSKPPGQMVGQLISGLIRQLSPVFAGGVILVWCVAELKKRRDRQRMENQSGLDSINTLSWSQFESLLSEAFRREGFSVEHLGQSSPDGGIDQRLVKAGAITLVQCKHWKQWKVGVTTVRELLGVVTSERAQSGILVTSGRFTGDAIAFASRNPIRLIDGKELVEMISAVQTLGRIRNAFPPPSIAAQGQAPSKSSPDELKCPKCGAGMVRRVAKTGQHAGAPFLGCSRYPACRGIRNLASKS